MVGAVDRTTEEQEEWDPSESSTSIVRAWRNRLRKKKIFGLKTALMHKVRREE